MSGRPGRSGGSNAISLSEHLARGTFRPARHAAGLSKPEPVSATDAERREALRGLGAVGQRVVRGLLAEFGDWHAAARFTLREYGRSCDTLAAATDDAERRRETRRNLALLRELNLERR